MYYFYYCYTASLIVLCIKSLRSQLYSLAFVALCALTLRPEFITQICGTQTNSAHFYSAKSITAVFVYYLCTGAKPRGCSGK